MNITFIYNDIQIYSDRTYEQSSNKDGKDAQTTGQGYKKRGHQVAEGCRRRGLKEEMFWSFSTTDTFMMGEHRRLWIGHVWSLSMGQPREKRKILSPCSFGITSINPISATFLTLLCRSSGLFSVTFTFCSSWTSLPSTFPVSSTQDLLRAPWVVPISWSLAQVSMSFFSCRSSQMQERGW